MRSKPDRFARDSAVPFSDPENAAGSRQPLQEIGGGPFGPRRQLGLASGRGLAVPGADVLADVAAEDPAVESIGERLADRTLVLDRPVADAPPRVELVGTDEGVRRAGVEASGAGPAVAASVRLVGLKLDDRPAALPAGYSCRADGRSASCSCRSSPARPAARSRVRAAGRCRPQPGRGPRGIRP